jgi:hypothetical protein
LIGARFDEKVIAGEQARVAASNGMAWDVDQMVADGLWRRERAEKEEAEERLAKLSGNWISADGQKKAKLDYDVLEFGKVPDWPDLEDRCFLINARHRIFLTESGRYHLTVFNDQPDTMIFYKYDRTTKSVSLLTLYREGSPHAASRSPLPETPPPPQIQALLDLIPNIPAQESVAGMNQRIGSVWKGKMELFEHSGSMGESDSEVDLGVDGQWLLLLSQTDSGELHRFRLVRTWVKDWREKQGPIVERVVYPYYEFGKIITGPMQSRPAGE